MRLFELIRAALSRLRADASPVWNIDWLNDVSDHPAHNGKPPAGPCNRVLIDGQDVWHLPIYRLRTGARGFVEFKVNDCHGHPLLRWRPDWGYGEMLPARIEGRVEYRFIPEEAAKASG